MTTQSTINKFTNGLSPGGLRSTFLNPLQFWCTSWVQFDSFFSDVRTVRDTIKGFTRSSQLIIEL